MLSNLKKVDSPTYHVLATLHNPNECDMTPGQSMHPRQSDWMAHWAGKIKENGRDTAQHPMHGELDKESVISNSRVGDSMSRSLRTSSKSLRYERLDCQPFVFGLSRNKDIISAPGANQTTIAQRHVKFQSDHDTGNIVSGEYEDCSPSVVACPRRETKSLPGNSALQSRGQQVKFYNFFEKNIALSRSPQDDFMGSSSNAIPYRFNSEKFSMLSFEHERDMSCSSSAIASGDCSANANHGRLQHEQYQSYSAHVIHQEKINNCQNSGKSGMSLVKEYGSGKGVLMPDSLLNNAQLPGFVGQQSPKSENCSDVGFHRCQSNPLQTSDTEEVHHQYSSAGEAPFLRHVETKRLYSMLDSMDGVLPAAPPKFSQVPHCFFIGKNTDVNLCKGGQIFNSSSVCTKFQGKMVCEFLSLSSDFALHSPQGVKLQPLGNSGNVGKGNVEHANSTAALVELRNESLIDTDTADMDHFQEQHNRSRDVASSAPYKDLGQIASTSRDLDSSSREEVEDRMPNKDVPDIKQQHCELLTGPRSIYVRGPSASRTHSLGSEQLLSHTEQLTGVESSPCPASIKESDLNSRWVKRLKQSPADNFGLGTKSAKIGEVLFPRKLSKFSNETESDPMICKVPMIPDHTAIFCKEGESASMDLGKVDIDAKLSYSWIQRWCKKSNSFLQKKQGEVGLCETGSSKMAPEKHYPGIAAMALMGKVLSGLRPRYFQNRGSLIVWNFEKVL